MNTKRSFITICNLIMIVLIGSLVLSGCGSGKSSSPTIVPTLIPTNESTSTTTPTEVNNFAEYNNSFDEITDISSSGFTSSPTAESSLKMNTQNVKSGSQSLEVDGTLADAQYSTLSINFPVISLVGEDRIDLSEKAISLAVFLPKGSPIDIIYFSFTNGDNTVSIPVPRASQIKGQWYKLGIDLKRVIDEPTTIIWGNSSENAKLVLQGCKTISIAGTRNNAGKSVVTSFLVDDLSWTQVGDDFNSLPVNNNVDSIRKYADLLNMKIGALMQMSPGNDYLLDPDYARTLVQEYNLMTASCSSWPNDKPADPAGIDFDYTYSDEAMAFASSNHLAVRNFTGGWNAQLPLWLLNAPFTDVKPILENRVAKDVGRYSSKIYMWDVFNEVVNDQGNGFRNRQNKGAMSPDGFYPYGYSYSPWVDGVDTSVIKAAFITARNTDPSAKYFLNEFDDEQIGTTKSEFFYRFVSDMKKEGVPIDGVGFELHLFINGNSVGYSQTPIDTYLANVAKNVKRYSNMGLLVEFSELEVAIRTDDIDLSLPASRAVYDQRLQTQADLYGGLMKIAVENKNVTVVNFWEVSDDLSSVFTSGNQLFTNAALFDLFYQPKPAYFAVLDALKGK